MADGGAHSNCYPRAVGVESGPLHVHSVFTARQKSLEQPLRSQAAYANEPFLMRLVNRNKFDAAIQPSVVEYISGKAPGTIIIETKTKHLYLVRNKSQALRFGIVVGTAGNAWKGVATFGRKSLWPVWYPTDEMRKVARCIPAHIPPGDDNPLGARAFYLYQGSHDTLYRIHGTSEPWTIGTKASSGCIRMFNEDIIALYDESAWGLKLSCDKAIAPQAARSDVCQYRTPFGATAHPMAGRQCRPR